MSKSKVFIAILVAFVLGIGVHSLFPVARLSIIALLTIAFLLGLGVVKFWKNHKLRLILLAGLFFVLGMTRFDASIGQIFDTKGIFSYQNENISIRGVITSLPEYRGSRASYLITTEQVLEDLAWQPTHGKIRLYTNRYPEFSYGDRLVFTCQFDEEEDVGIRGRLAARKAALSCFARQGVERIGINAGDPFLGVLMNVRTRMLRLFGQALPDPQAGLVAGLLVGERAGLTPELDSALRRTGTMHIVAISGFNVAMITSILFAVLSFGISRKRAFWATVGFLIAFVFFVGAGASVVRAAIMGGTVLFSKYLGRTGAGLRLLIFAAALMLVVNPWLLRFDLGFVLSFAATFGLLVFTPPLKQWFKFLPEDFRIRETFSETLSATIATLPFTAFTFGMISFVAPIANLLVLLLVPIATWVGAFLAIFAAVPLLGPFFNWFSWVLLTAILGFIEFFGTLSFAALEIPHLPFVIAVLAVIAVAGAAFFAYRYTRKKFPVQVWTK